MIGIDHLAVARALLDAATGEDTLANATAARDAAHDGALLALARLDQLRDIHDAAAARIVEAGREPRE